MDRKMLESKNLSNGPLLTKNATQKDRIRPHRFTASAEQIPASNQTHSNPSGTPTLTLLLAQMRKTFVMELLLLLSSEATPIALAASESKGWFTKVHYSGLW